MNQTSSLPVGPLVQAAATQLVLFFFFGGFRDGGVLLEASMLASLPFWLCVIWRAWPKRPTGLPTRLFIRWGLLAFVLIGTPLLWPFTRWLHQLNRVEEEDAMRVNHISADIRFYRIAAAQMNCSQRLHHIAA